MCQLSTLPFGKPNRVSARFDSPMFPSHVFPCSIYGWVRQVTAVAALRVRITYKYTRFNINFVKMCVCGFRASITWMWCVCRLIYDVIHAHIEHMCQKLIPTVHLQTFYHRRILRMHGWWVSLQRLAFTYMCACGRRMLLCYKGKTTIKNN